MILDVQNITKRYDSLLALDNMSIGVDEGEIYGLLGPNGSGKTTLINCILSLLKYDTGVVKIFGEEMSPTKYDIKSKIGYVPQEIEVFDELNVYDNIEFFCGLYIRDKKTRKKYVEEAIEFVGLDEFRKSYPKKLSGGLKRRLNLACGIAHKPRLLILDEPTVAVDPQSRNLILENIIKLKGDGVTVIYTTHYMEEVEKLCTKITIMDKGKNIITGTKTELMKAVGISDTLILENITIDDEELEFMNTKLSSGASLVDQSLYISIRESLEVTRILSYLEMNNIQFSSMKIKSPTLNDVFLEITGKQLRDY